MGNFGLKIEVFLTKHCLKLKKHIKIIILFSFLLNSGCLFSQIRSYSNYEWRWAFWRPIAAVKCKKALPKAMIVYEQSKKLKEVDSLQNGGKLDAFRHTFVMAYLAQKVNKRKLLKLGIAHEKGNERAYKKNKLEDGERADSLSCVMDLYNNTIGITIGHHNKFASTDSLRSLVLRAIQQGDCLYIKRNHLNHYVTCENKEINFSEFKNNWFVPKCLIKTNE